MLMGLIAILIALTLLVVVGFFVQVASSKADGRIKAFGKYLSIWIFVLAGLVLVGIATAPMFGGRPFGVDLMRNAGPHGMMMDRMMRPRAGQLPEVAPSPTPAPAPETGPTPEADRPPQN
jgi:hypothetical protein